MHTVTLQENELTFIKNTATSKILFTEDAVFKVKRKVYIPPFIDYQTKEKRGLCITKEFVKGSRYTPVLYNSQVLLNGPGLDQEPAICMKKIIFSNKLSENTLFDYLSSPHHNCKIDLKRLFDQIKDFHLQTEIVTRETAGSLMSVTERFSMLCKEAELLNQSLEEESLHLLEKYLAYYQSRYLERILGGKIRELHGDLHSGNILYDGDRFYFFDFLDFKDSYTMGDYLNDIGFFLADIFFFGIIGVDHQAITKLAFFFYDDPVFLLLFTAYGALNRANVFIENHSRERAGVFYQLFSMLLWKGKEFYDEY